MTAITEAEITRHNAQFLRSRGRLRVFCASDATVVVRGDGHLRQVCQIGYSTDGSIRVQWPYLRIKQGIVAPVVIPDKGGARTINLHETGRFTSQLVKFSHHTSGATHFNKTKYTTNEVRRASFPLNGPIGRVFELSAYFPSAYKSLERLKPGRLYIVFDVSPQMPHAVLVRAEWRRKESVVQNAHVRRASVGPLTQWMSRHTKIVEPVAFVAPPLTCAITDYMLCLTCQPIVLPLGASQPGAVFLGGFDAHERSADSARTPARLGGCLIAMYPADSPDAVVKRVGTIDITPFEEIAPAG